jgi:transposase-like protein
MATLSTDLEDAFYALILQKLEDQRCPVCRSDFTDKRRSRIIEKIIGKFETKVSCIHAERGCDQREE